MFRVPLQESADLRPLEPFEAPLFLALIERERDHFGAWLPWGATIDTEEKASAFIQRLADRQATDEGRGYAIWLDGEMAAARCFERSMSSRGTARSACGSPRTQPVEAS